MVTKLPLRDLFPLPKLRVVIVGARLSEPQASKQLPKNR